MIRATPLQFAPSEDEFKKLYPELPTLTTSAAGRTVPAAVPPDREVGSARR